MSKAITGAVLIGAAAIALTVLTGGLSLPGILALTSTELNVLGGLALAGIAMEAGAIAGALTANRGMGITTRQPAAFRQLIYGEQRVGGIFAYQSTTGSHKDQYNFVIVLAGHEIDSIVNLYLDGRQVFWGSGGTTRNGVYFGGNADSSTHVGPDGVQYNFGGKVFCSPFFGDQTFQPDSVGGVPVPGGGFSTALYANDGVWGASSGGRLPCLMGCAYVYLKLEYDTSLFPGLPEIKFTIRGKNNIWDPRTSTRGYSTNWALLVADQITDTAWGLGDIDGVDQDQLIAAANVCDEQVNVAATGGTESRYTCHLHDDSSVSPGDRMQRMMNAAMGRLSRIGGSWFIWPAYWQGASFSFNSDSLTGPIQWDPFRSLKDLCNRVAGTYIAANYPFNTAGDLYDANGFYDGMLANNFPFAFQPTSYPQYAQDPQHGYAADEYLQLDSGLLGAWSGGETYNSGDVVSESGIMYKSLADGNVGNNPTSWTVTALIAGGDTEAAAEVAAKWVLYQNLLPKELTQDCCLSVTQAQRCAKIFLLRNRQQGSGVFPMALAALTMQPLDVMQFSFAEMGWTNKNLEIAGDQFTVDSGERDDSGKWTRPPSIKFDGVKVQETDPSVYEWDETTEELTVYDVPALPTQQTLIPAPPTGMSLTSSAATALVALDGVVTPRVEVQWTTPADILTTQIQIQYQLVVGGTPGPWIVAGLQDVALNSFYVAGVVAGQTYNFRIRSLRPNGVGSLWVEEDGLTVSTTIISQITSAGLSPNVPKFGNNATLNSTVAGSAATIQGYGPGGVGYGFTQYVGGNALAMSAFSITGEAFDTVYYVVYDTVGLQYLAFTGFNSTLVDTYIFIGALETCDAGYTGTGGGTGGGSGGGGGDDGDPVIYTV